MACQRCGGFMVVETAHDLLAYEAGAWIQAARCVNCGNFEDLIIRANRSPRRPHRPCGGRDGNQGIEQDSAEVLATDHRRLYGGLWKAGACH